MADAPLTEPPEAFFDSIGMPARLLFAAVLFAIGCVPLLVADIFPFMDFYNHLARYFILSNYETLDTIQKYYVPNWRLLPNMGLDLIAVYLLGGLSPIALSKTILFLIFFIQYSGALFLQFSLTRTLSPLSMVLLPLLFFSYILNWGFSNFLLGLGFSFWCLGAWFILRERSPRLAILLSCLLGLILFFIHGFSFFIYGIVLFAFELQMWLKEDSKTIGGLATRIGQISIQALLPMLVFLTTPTAQVAGGLTTSFANLAKHSQGGTIWGRLAWEATHRLEMIFRVIEGPYRLLDLIFVLILTAMIGIGLRSRWLKIEPHLWLPLGLIAGLYVVMPPNLFSSGYMPERLPLIFAFLLAIGLQSTGRRPQIMAAVLAGTVAILMIRTAAVAVGLSNYSNMYQEFLSDSSQLTRGARVKSMIVVLSDPRDEIQPTCNILVSLLVPTREAVVPLFANFGGQPLAKTPRYFEELGHLPESPDLRFEPLGPFYEDYLSSILNDTKFDYLVICGGEKLQISIPDIMVPVAEYPGWYQIYKILR